MSFDFMISNTLAQQLADHRWWRFCSRQTRIDCVPAYGRTPAHVPGVFEDVSTIRIKRVVQLHLARILKELADRRRISRSTIRNILVVERGRFVSSVRQQVRQALHLKDGRKGDLLLDRMAQGLYDWVAVENVRGPIVVSTHGGRAAFVSIEADKLKIILAESEGA